jgi:hypothetical protein
MNGFLCPDNGGGPGQRQRGEAQNTELKHKIGFSIKYGVRVYFDSMSRDVHSCSHWLRPRSLPPGSHMKGAIGSAKVDD